MAQLATGPPKFRHPEWVVSNQVKYANAEGERAAAERLIAESERVVDETAKRTFKTQRDVNKKLGMKNNYFLRVKNYQRCKVASVDK